MRFWPLFFLLLSASLVAEEMWKTVVLGCGGGPRENNLSGYLLAPIGSNHYTALDAGSLLNGIYIAHSKGSFDDIQLNPETEWNAEAEILRSHVKAYLISHAHLDHVAGLILNSPVDTRKTIYGLDSTLSYMKKYLFNWKIWPNFGSEGKKPLLNQYHYQRLPVGKKTWIADLGMTVEPFILSHPGGYQSTAFLIEASGSYVLYFGDTSADSLEKKKHIEAVWKRVTPLIQQQKLRAIFLECSYTNETPAISLFGHLDPQYFMQEMGDVAKQAPLKNIKVIVTHRKESLKKGASSWQVIQEELEKKNILGFELIFPEQGQKITF